MSLPFRVKAAYDYNSPHEDDLSFLGGQIITVTELEDEDWYIGEYTDSSGTIQSGLFPKNFVERYEPAPPPRPSRSTRPKATDTPVEQAAASVPASALAQTQDLSSSVQSVHAERDEPQAPLAPVNVQRQASVSKPAPQAVTSSYDNQENFNAKSDSKSPPEVSEKPSSFRDRIAAFNKSAAPPIAPFKPSALGSSGFIKKPFVAPPPSRNAYVPQPTRESTPQKVYRREEDPEIAERQAQDQENAEKAGLLPSNDDAEEETPTVSLKERIALLQKQQAEQAARRGEAATKEKPKKPPPKKKSETQDSIAADIQTTEAAPRQSTDAEDERPVPPPPQRAVRPPEPPAFSDGNEADHSGAGETTEPETGSCMDELPTPRVTTRVPSHEAEEEEEQNAAESEEEDEMDEEEQRQQALRERMAKLSGGMGMPGMFGPPGGMPMMGMAAPAQKKKTSVSKPSSQDAEAPIAQAPRVPVMSPVESSSRQSFDQRRSIDNSRSQQPVKTPETERDQPPIHVASPSAGSETDDELPGTSQARDTEPRSRPVPPVPSAPPVPRRQESISQPRIASDLVSEGSPSIPARVVPKTPEQRGSAAFQLPPLPISTMSPIQGQSEFLQRQGESEYEGDYDTDIASGVKHKDALKAHARESSVDESTLADEPMVRSPPQIPSSPPSRHIVAPRPVPPLPPIAHRPRVSIDGAGSAQPMSPNSGFLSPADDNDYDPYRTIPPIITPSRSGANSPMVASQPPPSNAAPPPLPMSAAPPPVPNNAPPPPLPTTAPPPPVPQRNLQPDSEEESEGEDFRQEAYDEPAAIPPPPPQAPQRAPSKRDSRSEPMPGMRSARSSTDVDRSYVQRRSTDQRLSTSNEFIASDISLGESSGWWTHQNQLPPVLQDRTDLFFEVEESTTHKRGGKSITTKEVYVLFRDYSQTVVSVRYDPKNPSDVNFDQRHEPPPPSMRQDQLEAAYSRYGAKVAEAVEKKHNTVVGDGSPQGLITELLQPLDKVLYPVGTRAYGALVYSNLANATVQQFDEIRPGDIVSFRNAKFQGKHGGVMHQKYQLEAGKPDHVAVVVEWDGTKKKVRAAEQGRESKKCKVESFRLGDLRSGEVRVWRLMSRQWLGWDEGDA